MTLFICNRCKATSGCKNELTTHEMECWTCAAKNNCDMNAHPEKYNHCYIQTKGLCTKCVEEFIKTMDSIEI